jgi:predicted TIM-barrel fold metal-dependent hydrolase
MIIDFHTHFFPDKIAKPTVEKLADTANVNYYGDGTAASLVSFMRQDGVTISVNQPVATKREQVVSINRKMVELNKKSSDIICFGTLHPDFEAFEEELAFLNANGVKGIKLHPEYQCFCPEDRKMLRLYESCVQHDIMVLFHAGVDLGYKDVHCTPRGMWEILDMPGLTLVLAHMGGYRMWDDVERYLVGRNVYFDLAYCNEMDNVQLKRMIEDHGSDKVLFATDFPLERAKVIKDKVEALGLSEKDKENIYFRNAGKLLKLDR